jgi:hypothetical protein
LPRIVLYDLEHWDGTMAEGGQAEKRVVWVLGAGFSKPLGGPLLPQLLSRRLEKEIQARFPSSDANAPYSRVHAQPTAIVRNLYEYGLSDERLRSPASISHKMNLWAHAEEFIDYLDTALEPPPKDGANPHAVLLTQIVREVSGSNGPSLPQLQAAARRIVAAECCAFLQNVNPRSERWQPYRTWLRSLRPSDTIVTFNYDRVIETLCDAQDADASHNRGSPSCVMPLVPSRMDDPGVWSGCCPLLKLHGSVDWKRTTQPPNPRALFEATADPVFALTCEDEEIAIATPGPSKFEASREFVDVWSVAESALSRADAIVFVGYRFPETDADAREKLLQSIGANRARHLAIHIVLGHLGHDSIRLRALLRYVAGRNGRDESGPRYQTPNFLVHSHPLFAQDFFSVLDREELLTMEEARSKV